MKNLRTIRFGMPALILALICLLVLGSTRALAEIEISIDEDQPAATEKPTPVPAAKPAVAVQQPTAAQEEGQSVEVEEESGDSEAVEVESEEPASKPVEAHGFLKMKDVYEAGIKAYRHKEYDQAIKYLGRALEMKDKYTPKYYYAEAHAMLGVIFQFYVIHPAKAYRHYRAALDIDANTRTAKRHIREVYRYRNGKD